MNGDIVYVGMSIVLQHQCPCGVSFPQRHSQGQKKIEHFYIDVPKLDLELSKWTDIFASTRALFLKKLSSLALHYPSLL